MSNVRMSMSKESFNELYNFVDKRLSERGLRGNNLLSTYDIDGSCDQCYIGWNDVKWDETSEAVTAIIAGIIHLQRMGYSYHITVLGDRLGDVREYKNEGEKDAGITLIEPKPVQKFDDSVVLTSIR